MLNLKVGFLYQYAEHWVLNVHGLISSRCFSIIWSVLVSDIRPVPPKLKTIPSDIRGKYVVFILSVDTGGGTTKLLALIKTLVT